MKKKKYLILILVAVIILTGVLVMAFAGDKENKPLSTEDAKKVVLSDLNVKESKVDSIHVHAVTENNIPCYSVYVSVGGKNWEYTIDGFTGEILKKIESDHGHSH